jgi:CubicO group peptidase (beta-lactamase class C family)
MPFDQYLEENIFIPLGMEDTFFHVPEDKMNRFLPNQYWDRENNKLTNTPEGEGVVYEIEGVAMRNYQKGSLFSGGGGLVSTIMDYMRFCEMLRNGGTFNGVPK